MKPTLRFSKAGLAAAGLFLLLAVGVFCWIFFIASKNPADSGESGILMLPFMMPWVTLLPLSWAGPFGLWWIFLNTLILYLLFGGLRFKRSGHKPSG